MKVDEDIDDYQHDFEEPSNAPRSESTSKTLEKTFMTADQLTTDTTTTMSILKNRKSYYPSSGRSFIQSWFSKYLTLFLLNLSHNDDYDLVALLC